MAKVVFNFDAPPNALASLLEGYLSGLSEVCHTLFGAKGEAVMYEAVGDAFKQYLKKRLGIDFTQSEPWDRYCEVIEFFTAQGFYSHVELEAIDGDRYWMLESGQYAGNIWEEQKSWERGTPPCPLWAVVVSSLAEIGYRIVRDEVNYRAEMRGYESTFHFVKFHPGSEGILARAMREIRESMFATHLLNVVAENTTDAIFLKNLDGRYLFANKAVTQLMNKPLGDILGNDNTALLSPETAAMISINDREVIRSGGVATFEEVINSDGVARTYLTTKGLYRDAEGNLAGQFGISRDITERKQAEERNFHLAAIVESSDDAIIGKTLEGIITSWNKGAERIYGYSEREMIGTPISRLVPPERECEIPWFHASLTHGQHIEHFETVRRRKDGQCIHVSLTLSPIRDANGRTIGISTIARDITEHKNTEQSAAILNFALNNVHEAAFLIDETGRFLYVNRESCRVLGYTREEFLGMGASDVDPDFPPERWPRHWQDLQTRHSLTFEGRHRTKDGRILPVEVSASYFEYDGKGYNLALVRDITERKRVEEELRINEQRYRMAQAIGHTGNWEYNLQTTTFWGSDEAKHIYGFDTNRSDFTTDEVESCIPERDRVHQALVDMIEADKPYNLEFEIRPRNSSEPKIIASIAEFQRDEHGNPLMVTGVIQDITARKRAEEALRVSEERFRAISNYTYDWENWFGPDGKLIWVNPGVLRFTGYSVEECRGLADFPIPLIDPEDREKIIPHIRGAIQGGSGNDVEFRIRCKDGSTRWAAMSWQPIYAGDGTNLGYRSSIRDITERKRAEEALRKSEEMFRILITLSPAGVYLTDPEGNCLYANPRWLEMAGLSLPEALGTGWTKALYPEDRDRVGRLWHHMAQSGQPAWNLEYRFQRPDETTTWVHGLAAPLQNDQGVVTGYLGINVDITERKHTAEELRRQQDELAHALRLATLGEMASMLAHELNQPLCSIMTFSDLAKARLKHLDLPNPDLVEALNTIGEQAARAGKIIQNIRSFVRKHDFVKSAVHISSIIQDAVQFMGHEIKKQNINLTMQLDDSLPPIQADRILIEQVVMNLVRNALDAMSELPPLQRRLTIRTSAASLADILVEVIDSGIGVPQADHDKLFQSFYTTKPNGLGMGLSISRSIVHNHGGKIGVRNNSEQGTIVWFNLPSINNDADP